MRKSRFITFILSAIPGLSHLYLGIPDRALTFFILFLGVCGGGAVLSSIFPGFNLLGPFIFMGLVLVWFIALVDAFSWINTAPNAPGVDATNNLALNNRKIITIALSMIPGAGHMYLGLLKQGAQLMTAFFLVMFITDWLHLSLLGFILPVIWFYSLFDAYHLLEEGDDGLQPDESPMFDWFKNHPAWLGWGLIILGGLVIVQRIVSPVLVTILTAEMRNFIETTVVALILIIGGIVMLVGNKNHHTEEEKPCGNGE